MDRRTLLPALEAPRSEYGQAGASVREVVIAGLDWPTPYWPELAVVWLEDGAPMDDEIADLLLRIADTKTFPQKSQASQRGFGEEVVSSISRLAARSGSSPAALSSP